MVDDPVILYFWEALEFCYKNSKFDGQKALADAAGVHQATVSEALCRKKGRKSQTQAKIAAAFGYELLDFLFLGRSLLADESVDDFTSGNEASPLIKISDLPNPECQFVKNFSELPKDWKQFEKDFIAIPLVAHEVAAGQPVISREYIKGWAVIHISRLNGKNNLVAIGVKSRSMEPTIRDGAIVCVDRDQRDILPGKIFAVAWGDGVVIRRIYKEGSALQLVCDNTDQEFRQPLSVDLKKRDNNPVIGKVVWAWIDFENDVKVPRRPGTDL